MTAPRTLSPEQEDAVTFTERELRRVSMELSRLAQVVMGAQEVRRTFQLCEEEAPLDGLVSLLLDVDMEFVRALAHLDASRGRRRRLPGNLMRADIRQALSGALS